MIGFSRISAGRSWRKVTLASAVIVALDGATTSVQSSTFTVPPLTAEIKVRLQRPTTLVPLAWDNTGVIAVSLVMIVDGQEYRCTGGTSGGIRTNRIGQEISEYLLSYKPTKILQNNVVRRLGELATVTPATAYVRLERISGIVNTTLIVAEAIEAPRPDWATHNSVAFDAVTSALENAGDAIISLSHTASGSDRAAFAGAGCVAGGAAPASTSCTYGGTGMTEVFDVGGSGDAQYYRSAGYAYIAPGTTQQTVTQTWASTPSSKALGVISMTGVHQTTGWGTAATGTGTSGIPTVTVGSIGADDLVVDNLMEEDWNSGGQRTVGADQTERYDENSMGGFDAHCQGSSQPGTAGGVMSWSTRAAISPWILGAIAFKPSVAGGRTTKNTRGSPLGMEIGMGWRMNL